MMTLRDLDKLSVSELKLIKDAIKAIYQDKIITGERQSDLIAKDFYHTADMLLIREAVKVASASYLKTIKERDGNGSFSDEEIICLCLRKAEVMGQIFNKCDLPLNISCL